jgi:hypothetical protein
MPNQLNELSINLPVVSVAPITDEPKVADGAYSTEITSVDDDEAKDSSYAFDPFKVTIYVESIRPTEYGSTDKIACFDLVLSVGIFCDDGKTKTYSLVKRIAMDKERIAKQAECGAPISIVEKQAEAKGILATPTLSRLRRLAGLE